MLVAGARPLTEDEQLYLRLLELGECVVLAFIRDMHLLSKINVNIESSCRSCVRLYIAVHFIITFHLFFMHDSYAMHMHAIGVPEGVTLLEFEQVLLEELQQAQEQEVQALEGANEEVLECLDHQPSSFLKGKLQSILSLLCLKMVTLSIFIC